MTIPFSHRKETTWWEHHYDEPGYIGEYFRKRMMKALTWIDESCLSRESALIFDAGCGGGQMAVQAALHGYRVIAMDYSMNMLTSARDLSNQNAVCQNCFFSGDVEGMPVRDGSLDVILCLGVLSYLKSETTALVEFARTLKPGGFVIISATNKARLLKRLDLPYMFLQLGRKISQKRRKAAGSPPHKLDELPQRSYLIPRFTHSLINAGFSLSECVTFAYDRPTLFGREFLNESASAQAADFFERFQGLPLVASLGSMWMIKAYKK